MSPVEMLRGMAWFRALPGDELARVPVDRVEQGSGETIFAQGSAPDAVYGVLTGRVKLSKASVRGRELILEVIGAGELFGVVAVTRGIARPESAVALERTACVRIEAQAFRSLVEQHPQVAARLLESISRRLIEANMARLSLAAEPADVRLARVLLTLADKFGARRDQMIIFSQAFTRQSTADLAGTTVETCIRVMSRWTRDGIIGSSAGRLVLLQPEALRRLLGGDL